MIRAIDAEWDSVSSNLIVTCDDGTGLSISSEVIYRSPNWPKMAAVSVPIDPDSLLMMVEIADKKLRRKQIAHLWARDKET